MRHILVGLALLSAVPACAQERLFPDVALASIRANHPEFASNPLMVTCIGPSRTTTFRGEPDGPPDVIVQRVVVDPRCDYPWNHAQGAIEPKIATTPYVPWHDTADRPKHKRHKKHD